MESQEIIKLAAQGAAILFTLILFVMLVLSMRKDGKLGADEASKVVIMGILIYMTIVNAERITEYPTFGDGTYLLLLASVLLLAGIDVYKAKGLLNGDRGKDSKDSK